MPTRSRRQRWRSQATVHHPRSSAQPLGTALPHREPKRGPVSSVTSLVLLLLPPQAGCSAPAGSTTFPTTLTGFPQLVCTTRDDVTALVCPGSGTWLPSPALSAAGGALSRDRKSTRLNSSHLVISYAVFC